MMVGFLAAGKLGYPLNVVLACVVVTAVQGIPILFIPGNGGSYEQVRGERARAQGPWIHMGT